MMEMPAARPPRGPSMRAGLPPSFFGYPMYLLTVRGRKI